MGQSPSVGRVVHYVTFNGNTDEHRAAIITAVTPDRGEDVVSLCVFELGGTQFIHGVFRDDNVSSATWHFPEMV